jgi:hypothetical protein
MSRRYQDDYDDRRAPRPPVRSNGCLTASLIGCGSLAGIGVLCMAAFCAIGAMVGPRTNSGGYSTEPDEPRVGTPSVGDIVVFKGDDSFVSATEKDMEEVTRLSNARDTVGLQRMAAQGKLFVAKKGDEAKLLKNGLFNSRIRMTTGPNSGDDGWTPSEYIRKK